MRVLITFKYVETALASLLRERVFEIGPIVPNTCMVRATSTNGCRSTTRR